MALHLDSPTPEAARRRAWAAGLRDGGGPHAEAAGLLCRVLDLCDDLGRRAARPDGAANLADGLKPCVEALVRRLLDNGAPPPR